MWRAKDAPELRFVKACFHASRGVDKKKGRQTGKRARSHADSVVHQQYGLFASDRTGGPDLSFPWHRPPPIRQASVVPHVVGEREASPHADGPGAFQGSFLMSLPWPFPRTRKGRAPRGRRHPPLWMDRITLPKKRTATPPRDPSCALLQRMARRRCSR